MTYDDILTQMKTKYRTLAGFDADDASDIGIRLKVLAAELAAYYARLAELEKQIVPLTSTGVYLEYHAEAKGLFRKPGLKATGRLRFSRETAASSEIAIPAGVVCSVSGDEQITYITTAAGKLAAGATYVEIEAEAEEPGVSGNAATRAVKVMITPAAGITKVENPVPFEGGADTESDDSLRGRLLSSYRNLSNGTNAAYYYDIAMSHRNVTSCNVLPRNRGRGTVDVIIACVSTSVNAETIAELQAQMNALKEINVDVLVSAATRRVIDFRVELTAKKGYMPAHLEAVLDIGSVTWDMLEVLVKSWADWDAKDFTWEQFDLDTGNIFADD
jgi:uncharacterized phage protein gp47/JayE